MKRHMTTIALAVILVLPSCTTVVQPADCGGRPYACADLHDVKFCESRAVALEGKDCANAGLSVGKPFCFVSTNQCATTTYALKGLDCTVSRYDRLREWSECSPGTLTFRP
jgi:hypothetical protein